MRVLSIHLRRTNWKSQRGRLRQLTLEDAVTWLSSPMRVELHDG